jgi:hypothetical protein
MNPNKEFYDKLVALTGHIHQELEVLFKLKAEIQINPSPESVRGLDTIAPMLGILQQLSISIETIAKITRRYIIKDEEAEAETDAEDGAEI